MQRLTPSLNGGNEHERALRWLAGGVDSPVRAGLPVGSPSPFVVSGSGSKVVDSAGREYIDYLCAYGPVMLGHAHPRISRAVAEAVERGAVFGATHPEEVRLAERVCNRFPSIERVRFVSTGTEACMSAVRLARGHTRREKILRFHGCYHGHSDDLIFSAGASSLSTLAITSGVTLASAAQVLVVPYNDVRVLEETLAQHRNDVAAIIIEPVAGNMGLCVPESAYLETVRELATREGALLIFDEVITGFRLGWGGAQERYGVRPDLTCLGKTLGGGLPVAAFGGRTDVMADLAPQGAVFVGGTFSGNPACVAAAHAFLDVLEDDAGIYARLEQMAQRLADGLARIIEERALGFAVVCCASMVDFMFRSGVAHRNMQEALMADAGAYAKYYRAMLDRGVLLPPSQMELMFLTAAHSSADIAVTLEAAREALA